MRKTRTSPAAQEVSRRARAALAVGGVRSAEWRRAIDEMDRDLRDARNTANPGATADLTAAAIFVVLVGGGWAPSLEASAATHSLSAKVGTPSRTVGTP